MHVFLLPTYLLRTDTLYHAVKVSFLHLLILRIPHILRNHSGCLSLSFYNFPHDSLLLLLLRLATNVLEHLIHLLECLAGRFRDKEKREDKGEEAENSKERVRAETGVLDERWCNETLCLVSN